MSDSGRKDRAVEKVLEGLDLIQQDYLVPVRRVWRSLKSLRVLCVWSKASEQEQTVLISRLRLFHGNVDVGFPRERTSA